MLQLKIMSLNIINKLEFNFSYESVNASTSESVLSDKQLKKKSLNWKYNEKYLKMNFIGSVICLELPKAQSVM